MDTMTRYSGLRRRAELIGTTGAAVLGAGVGLFFARRLTPYALPLLLVGLVCHAWGMYEKHRLDSGAGLATAKWVEAAYWGCWLLLAALMVYIVSHMV